MRDTAFRQSKDSCQEAECLCRRVDESEVCPASPVSLQGETGKWVEGGHHLHILSWFGVEALPEAAAPMAPSPRKGDFLFLEKVEGTEDAGRPLQYVSKGCSEDQICVVLLPCSQTLDLVQVLDLLCRPWHCLRILPGSSSKPLLY